MIRGLVFGLVCVLGLGLGLGFAQAQVSEPVQALSRALQIPEVMAILAEEGMSSATEMLAEPGAVDPVWAGTVGRIYDTTAMEAAFLVAFDAEIAANPDVVAKAIAFFGSDLGQRALRLELQARRALQDEDVKATAEAAYANLWRDNPRRQGQVDQFAAANDLVESNVIAALNANLAFLRGVAMESGAANGLSEADMVAQVWSGEADARAETVKWLFPFLNLAYQPLTDAEVQAYLGFSQSDAGRQMNAAMFRAFDTLFAVLSRDLGRAYARQMVGQDI